MFARLIPIILNFLVINVFPNFLAANKAHFVVTNNVSVVTNNNSDDSTFVVTNNRTVVTNSNLGDPTGEPQRVMYLFPEIDTKQKALYFRPARAVV
jgi:hypothetical protein